MATGRQPFEGDPQTEIDRRVLRAAELARDRGQNHYVYIWEGLIAIARTKPKDRTCIEVPPEGPAVWRYHQRARDG